MAIEFHSREAAVDQCIALLNTGWPRGPKEEDLKLIVIGREGEGGYVEGVEIDANRLSQVDKAIDEFGETK